MSNNYIRCCRTIDKIMWTLHHQSLNAFAQSNGIQCTLQIHLNTMNDYLVFVCCTEPRQTSNWVLIRMYAHDPINCFVCVSYSPNAVHAPDFICDGLPLTFAVVIFNSAWASSTDGVVCIARIFWMVFTFCIFCLDFWAGFRRTLKREIYWQWQRLHQTMVNIVISYK